MKIKVSAVARAILDMSETDELKNFLEDCEASGMFVTMNKDLISKAKKSVRASRKKKNGSGPAMAAAFPSPPGVPEVDDPTCEAD